VRGNLSERLSGQRIAATNVDPQKIGVRAPTALKSSDVPEDAFGLPGGQFMELLGKCPGIAGDFERLEG
jgi:hypothetical protein